ncbi:MAG: homocysteine S-methyltransferase [Actinobacteria bacterium]|uniref:Unannotated protein n=1 Tax=freshwater metagenome TaxID=449393 RepID=A0A6J7EXZ6_9ZZZZ|nr:homocysteine S-methyltransferase [Actinomycetota bacterium]
MTEANARLVIVDGGLSTQLESMGNDVSGPLWTARTLLERPDAIEAAHRAFIDAGADVIITSSYQVSRQGFLEVGLTAEDADRALRRSVEVGRSAAADTGTIVAASVGPYGAITHDGREYKGNYGLSERELSDFHRERIEVLVEAGPDMLAIETIPDVREVEALAIALADAGGIPAWITFAAKDDGHVCAGQTIEDAVAAAATIPGIQRVGINCTAPVYVPGLIDRIRAATDLPVIVYPNAGGTWDSLSGHWLGVTYEDIVRSAREWRDHGATWIGGCCGTEAAGIGAISEALRGA